MGISSTLKQAIPGQKKQEEPKGGAVQAQAPGETDKSGLPNIDKILEKAQKPALTQNIMDLETAKAVMEKALQDAVMESTTNLTRQEVRKILILMMAYSYSRNPRLKILIVGIFKMNRSLTYQPVNILESLFGLPRMAEHEEHGKWARFKSWIGR